MADIKFEIIKKIGVLSKSDKGWAKEFNLIVTEHPFRWANHANCAIQI